MGVSKRGAKHGQISFPILPRLTSSMNKRLEKIGEAKAVELQKENSWAGYCTLGTPRSNTLDIPSSPRQAMEYLSRTWSPASSDYFSILSSHSLAPCIEDDREEKHDVLEVQELENVVQHSGDNIIRAEHISNWLSNGRSAQSAPQRRKPQHSSWMNIKSLLSGEILSSLLRGRRKNSRDEQRLHAAEIHAALSVASLSAAVAGIVANCSLEPTNFKNMDMICREGGRDYNMSTVVASAAALIATVCAEAAESLGAQRAHIASVINTGIATRTSDEVLTLTAAAATCLRGAATLKLRAASSSYIPEGQNILAQGAQLSVRTPAGKIQLRMLCIYLKHDKPTLKLGKKHLWRAITIYKEYRIIDAMEGVEEGDFTKDDHGFYLIALGTTAGTIQGVCAEMLKVGKCRAILNAERTAHASQHLDKGIEAILAIIPSSARCI